MAEIKDNTDKITKKPSRPSPLNSESGFTLIEALIALAVLTIGILALNAMQVSAIRGNSTSNSLSVATSVARDGFERLMNVDEDDPLVAVTDLLDPDDFHSEADLAGFNMPPGVNNVRWTVVEWPNVIDDIDNDGDGEIDEVDEREDIDGDNVPDERIDGKGIRRIDLVVTYTDRGITKTVETTFLKHEIL